jgi:hypothetical protein
MLWQKVSLKKEEESKLKNKLGTIDLADFYIYFANIMQIFIEGYGFKKSVEKAKPIDKNNNPIPLYTYPAIEYLQSLDFSNKRIFEFGSGNSTLFWLEKGAIVTSVENNKIWFEDLTKEIGENENHKFLFENGIKYYNAILEGEKKYDLIIIDGAENRLESAKRAIQKIKEDGMIIVDNSDWFENTTKFIRDELDFIQIDFYGFRPSKHNTSVTSVFFSRKSNFKTITQKQPSFVIGGLERHSQHDFESHLK